MTRYIAIDGHGGSGKTYLSEILAKKLNATLFHLDDFGDDYKPFIGVPKLLELIESTEADTIVYEGVGVFNSRFDHLNPYRILVVAAENDRIARGMQRDYERGIRSKKEWEKIWEIWNEAETKYFDETVSQKADYTFYEDSKNFDAQVKELIAKINVS